MILYKYHKANNYLLELIKRNSVWCSNPYDFNDPFDMRFLIDFKEIYNDLKLEAEKELKTKYPTFSHLIPNAIQQITNSN